MNTFFLSVTLILLSFPALSDSFDAKIHSVTEGDPAIIKFINGRVGFMPLHLKHSPLISGVNVSVELADDGTVLSMFTLKQMPRFASEKKVLTTPVQAELTILSGKEEVNELFHRLNKTYKEVSECYNRAHIWAYEEFTQRQLVMNKAFVFFSDEYIRTYKFKWWFHVAPYVLYRENGALFAAVLDHQFGDGPKSLKDWTDTWIETKKPCKVISVYSEYFNNTLPNECYLIKIDMYYWQPRDIEGLEKTGIKKESFLPEEVKLAYLEAFGISAP